MPSNSKTILLATGIFYPEAGGPAVHVRRIAGALAREGFAPVVLTYSAAAAPDTFPFAVLRAPSRLFKPLRWLWYVVQALILARRAALVYAFDLTSAGMPAFVAARLFRKKFLIRIGGDPIWERTVEKGKRFMSLLEYYEQGFHCADRPILFAVLRAMISRADVVVVYSDFVRHFYERYYSIPVEKMRVVKNPFPEKKDGRRTEAEPTALFAGRFVSYKNLHALIRAFACARGRIGRGILVLIGDGPDKESLVKLAESQGVSSHVRFFPTLPQEALFEEIAKASLCIAPGLTEYNPNFILECLSLGKPSLVSAENGLSLELREEFLFNAKNESEMESKLAALLSEEGHRAAAAWVRGVSLDQTWERVDDFHTNLVRSYCAAGA